MSTISQAKTPADLASCKTQLEQVWLELAESESLYMAAELNLVQANMKQEAVLLALNYMRQYAWQFVDAVDELAQCENLASL